ncbi:DUF2637 domain-containing protein [Mycobacterium sp. GA-2829]|uniref:DUF2637 domain-containing protein n=1 Tax=Mycobacterium sp. GA-2829 TaxID=1772283 RepID=UPI0007405221|nr:DUF2637 domain-containing protein [Mycobacterium sp. GA-2829]KUI29196.1 hypothetical protein AU194_20155 [Mycobacterium sp. GA-2829]
MSETARATGSTIAGGAAGTSPAATRFFWGWLIVATAMSIAGNVTHAVLVVEPRTVLLAAGAALVPPIVLLAATHSVALLVRSRVGGAVYWCAVLMTLALAGSAFVLSFTALRDLAVTVGMPESIAWLWPCAIDVAIAQATLCLLSVGRRGGDPATMAQATENVVMQKECEAATNDVDVTGDVAGGGGPVAPWRDAAISLVSAGVTSKDTDLVARILADSDAGIPPSTIGRTHGVHHTTVTRILSAATSLTSDEVGPSGEPMTHAYDHQGVR